MHGGPSARNTKHCSHARFTDRQRNMYKKGLNLPKERSTFTTKIMGYRQAYLDCNMWTW